MTKGKQNDTYGNESISSLKGADRVRLRPGVIFGSDGIDGCEHSFFEILSNSIDEAREGFGNVIEITRFSDNSVMVRDYGRGIPVDFNQKEDKTIGSWFSASSMPAGNTRTIRVRIMNSALD
jgi:DNA gyrase subunit B